MTLRLASVLVASSLLACHGKSESGAAPVDAAAPAPSAAAVPSAPMNVTPLPSASVAKVVNPAGLPPYTGPTGSVEGIVRVDGPAAPDVPDLDFSTCPEGRATYGKLFREGAAGPNGSRALADAVVAVTGYSNAFVPERDEAAQVAITKCAFAPRTIVMTFGQRLEVKNDSDQFWAPSLEQASMPALMIAAPHTLDPVKLYPPKPGWYSLVDRMKHTYARSDVYVILQPLHAISDRDGHFRIDGVPVGKLKVGAHVAGIGDAQADVEVKEKTTEKVELLLHYAPKSPAATPIIPKGTDGGRPAEVIK